MSLLHKPAAPETKGYKGQEDTVISDMDWFNVDPSPQDTSPLRVVEKTATDANVALNHLNYMLHLMKALQKDQTQESHASVARLLQWVGYLRYPLPQDYFSFG